MFTTKNKPALVGAATVLMLLSAVVATACDDCGETTNSQWTSARADGHAPISVMADHTHSTGEWMLSYRYVNMLMDGMKQGSDDASSADVFADGYIIAPEQMTMHMHMLGLMHALSDRLTLTAMIGYMEKSMDHRIAAGAAPLVALNGGSSEFSTRSEGFGDLKIGGLYRFWDGDGQRAHVGLQVSLPTGNITASDIVPGPGGRRERILPAPMQLGSGTVDLLPSITYLHQLDGRWSYGVQADAVVRTGRNDQDYRLGHQVGGRGWLGFNATDWLALTGRLGYRWTGKIHGQQADLLLVPPFNPNVRTVPTAFSENSGGQTVDAGLGINLYAPSGMLRGHRIAVEVGMPLWQDLNGSQLETDLTVTVGWQYAF